MSPTSRVYLSALLAFALATSQLHTRLFELAEAAGMFAESVESLLRDEQARSVLEPEYAKLRSRYKEQTHRLAQLSRDIDEVCKEHNKHIGELPPNVWPRRRPGMPPARYDDTEWREPNTLVKMFYATDLKVVFLCAKLRQLRSAVRTNDERIRQLSSALEEEQAKVDDLPRQIAEHRKHLREQEVIDRREARRLRERDANIAYAERRWIDFYNWQFRQRLRDPAPRPYPTRRIPAEPAELPLHAAARAAGMAMVVSSYQPVADPAPQVVSIPAPGTGFDVLFGCPQEVPVPVPAPAPEPSIIQQEVLAIPAPPEMVDTEMPDAPDFTEEDPDVSMVDAEPELVEVSVLDVEMVDAVTDIDMVDNFSEPLLCQGSPVPALPAPAFAFASMSTVLADIVAEQEQSQPSQAIPVVAHPVPAPVYPLPVFAAPEDTAMDAGQGGVAEAPQPVFVPPPPFFVPAYPSAGPSSEEVPPPAAIPAPPPAPSYANVDIPPAEATSPAPRPPSPTAALPTDPRLFEANVDLPPAVSTAAETRAQSEQPEAARPEPVLRPASPEPQQQQQQQQAGPPPAEAPAASVSADAPLEAQAPPPFTFGLAATAPTQSSPPPEETGSLSFEFEYPQPRRIAKPKSRLKRLQAQASASASAPAPAPVAPPKPGPPAPASAESSAAPVTAPAPAAANPAPQPSSSSSSSSSSSTSADKGKGKASASTPEAEPPSCAEWSDLVFPGEYLRSLCEDFIGGCASFMNGSALCGRLSPSWVYNWKQSTLINLGSELTAELDEVDYTHDEAAALVRGFFRFNLRRRLDGPDTAGKNAVLRHLKKLAAAQDLDLGELEF